MITLAVILNLIVSLWIIPEYLGRKRKIGFNWSLVACLFLSPIIGIIITLNSPLLDEFKEKIIINSDNDKKSSLSENNPKSVLEKLLKNDLLTKEEYDNKINILGEIKFYNLIQNSEEFANLKELLDKDLLTKEEYFNKVELLKTKMKSKVNSKNLLEDGFRISSEFIDGLAVVVDDDLNYGFVNEEGEIIIDTKYEFADVFNEDLALVRSDRLFGYIDRNGDNIIAFQYNLAEPFNNGIAKVAIDNEFFNIDKKGNKVSEYTNNSNHSIPL
ncbi:WG containing repeat-containing protein [Arenibacter nanhaiticus]|uniref:WG containing repeat-containing protein n=1 Tax=Arenibacter nanhaiticus TaxID=558155 RepID=A0A1M6KX27_9FLAO|nr:WG repeat-containing protein [Arenibacter nanhaiticus]SHJ63518.1 WG containing repeat-containing protein [Arenibacter nanhaiticus]